MKNSNKLIRWKLNNQGSTLFAVIICIAFIGILGSLMLSLTMTNLQMKLIESRSKKSFYSCEEIMENIKSAIQENASEAVKLIYEDDVLVNYAAYLEKDGYTRNTEIKQKVMARLLEMTCGVSGGYPDVIATAVSTGYELSEGFFNTYLNEEVLDNPLIKYTCTRVSCDENSYNVRFQGVTVQYEDGNGFRTAISSDIVITMPDFSFKKGDEEVVYRMLQPYQQYVLAADGEITSYNTEDETNIQGNVYAGAGIDIKGDHRVTMTGDNIITRGDIRIGDTASLTIGGTDESVPLSSVVWANNLLTYTSDGSSGSAATTLNINGVCVIKDDLTLEGLHSNVTLRGSYIGYSGKHDSTGSSIIINGAGSSLFMNGLTDLILAGRAHVSVQKTLTENNNVNIMTGESVAFKSNQRAYLMPAGFITDIKHNPLTSEDYINGAPDITIGDEAENAIYADAVDSVIPYKIAAKDTGGTLLRYYFLNFGSGRQGDTFFKTYYENFGETLRNMAPFTLGDVLLPNEADITAVGNVMGYQADTGTLSLIPGKSLNPGYLNDDTLDTLIAQTLLTKPVYDNLAVLKNKTVGSLGDLYSKISHLLTTDSTTGYRASDEAIAFTVKAGGIDNIFDFNKDITEQGQRDYHYIRQRAADSSVPVSFRATDPSEKYFCVYDADVVVELPSNPMNAAYNGILIASGSVTIPENAIINGLIVSTEGDIIIGRNVTVNGRLIATGDIRLGQNFTIGADATIVSELAHIFETEGTFLSNIFKNTEMTVAYTISSAANSTVDLSDMVSYENWRKIE